MKIKFAKKKEEIKETDKSIAVRLEDHFEITDASTIEGLLKDKRVGESDNIIGKQLESRHTSKKEAVTEKLLDDTKGSFGNKIRNSDAYEGDINILDRERVNKKKAAEDIEKAELASEKPKKLRWWETKTDDGLKIADIEHKKVKTAQNVPYDLENIDEEIDYDDEENWLDSSMVGKSLGYEEDSDDMFEENDEESNVYLIDKNNGEYTFGIIDDTVDERKTRQGVYDRIIDMNPELEFEINPNSLGEFSVNERTGETIIKVQLPNITDDFEIEDLEEGISFSRNALEKVDQGGTPMILGDFSYSGFAIDTPSHEIAQDAADFLAEEYEIEIDANEIEVTPEKIKFTIPDLSSLRRANTIKKK